MLIGWGAAELEGVFLPFLRFAPAAAFWRARMGLHVARRRAWVSAGEVLK